MANVIEKVGDYLTSASVSREVLRDKLSEFLAVERGGIKLYDQALCMVNDPAVSEKFIQFRDQTRKHEAILLLVMATLGIESIYKSPAAIVAEEKATGLLNTMISRNGLSAEATELNAMENIVLAETKDHADWELLGKIARQFDDQEIRDALKSAVDEVEPEEDNHLNWTKDRLAERAFAAITCSDPSRPEPSGASQFEQLPPRSETGAAALDQGIDNDTDTNGKPSR